MSSSCEANQECFLCSAVMSVLNRWVRNMERLNYKKIWPVWKLMRICPSLGRLVPSIFLALPLAGGLLCFEEREKQLHWELQEMEVATCRQHLVSFPGRAVKDKYFVQSSSSWKFWSRIWLFCNTENKQKLLVKTSGGKSLLLSEKPTQKWNKAQYWKF